MANELTWHDVLAEEKQQPYFLNTLQTVASERQSGVTIYPPQKDVFNAFRFTELGDVKVVILGQDRSITPNLSKISNLEYKNIHFFKCSVSGTVYQNRGDNK